jgi:hypothetical protein
VGRTGKQVRERYINKLDPSIKSSSWTAEEDQVILFFYTNYGPCWSHISRYIGNRPENMVKNRFYSHLKRVHKIEEKPNTLKSDLLLQNTMAISNRGVNPKGEHVKDIGIITHSVDGSSVVYRPAIPEGGILHKVNDN